MQINVNVNQNIEKIGWKLSGIWRFRLFSCRKQRLYTKKNVPRHEGMDKAKKRNIWTSQKKRNIINEM